MRRHNLKTRLRKILGLIGAVGLILNGSSASAATVTYDFTTDPTTGPNPLLITQAGFLDSTDVSVYWKAAGGNPGGFLAITWPLGNSTTIAEFPNIDPGKIVTAFKFECDMRVGNPQQNVRAADGFSINFARANDDVFINHAAGDFAAAGAAETGTKTGLAICFDTWSGNDLPDGRDFPDNGTVDDPGGIIIRVDNVTILRQPLPTYNGACADTDSLQTGPRDLPYWDAARAADSLNPLPDAAFKPESWAGLCWQRFSAELTTDGKVTVIFKGRKILDNFQTTFFPSAGGIVLAGRTGGADEHGHFDNLTLTTTAFEPAGGPPAPPTNLRIVTAGARRVLLAWDASVTAQVAYEIERDGIILPVLSLAATFEDRGVAPGQTVNYKVHAVDLAARNSTDATIAATTVAEVDSPGFPLGQIYEGIAGTPVADLIADAKFPASPDRIVYLNGLSFGETSNFGNTYGDNLGVRIESVLTAPETGQFRFFVRSDDASQFFINASGPAIPDPNSATPVAQEQGCCGAFEQPGAGDNGDGTFPTSEPISLTAGSKYGVLFLVKEGGGGDWGQVAMRKEGDVTPASALTPIRGSVLTGKGDPVGASVTITQQPQDATAAENSPVSLTVVATSASPYTTTTTYQWLKDGTPILSANGATYTVPLIKKSHAGKYKVVASVPGASATSSEVTVAVNDDLTAPTVASTTGSDSFDKITLVFSEPVGPSTAPNYSIAGLAVTGVEVLSPTTVRLTTAKQAENTEYIITLTGIQDTAAPTPNTIAAPNNTAKFKSWVVTPGKVKYEEWAGITGGTVLDLTADTRYPNNPDRVELRDAFEAAVDHLDNYGGKLSGWFTPDVTGNYVFFMSSDDGGELYLSTDETSANKKLIAAEPVWNGAREWISLARRDATIPENRSDTYAGTQWASGGTISLTAGKRYYTELLFKEGGGGDNGAMTVKLASAPDPAPGSPALSGSRISAIAPPTGGGAPVLSAVFSTTGVTLTFTGTLQSADNVEGPYAPVAGATTGIIVPFSSGPKKFYRSAQ